MALTKVTYSMIDGAPINVKDFGAVGDGVTDDTAALVAAAAALQDGQTLDFVGGTYLISYQGTPYSSVFGNVVMDFLNKRNISLVGNGATIKIVNHDITTNGGLRFVNFKGCKQVTIDGFYFDMSFTGANTSGSYYPFCGAITALDTNAAAPDFETLNSDFTIQNCIWKLYSPLGASGKTNSPYDGDPNNGFKIFPLFVSGPNSAGAYENQCRNITVDRCTFVDGHNCYGLWFWAWNNCKVTRCSAESFVNRTYYEPGSGTWAGEGYPMIRHIPFRTFGMIITDNSFRAKPTSERTGAFQGVAGFYMQANNMGDTFNWAKGQTIVSNNTVIISDGSSPGVDYCVYFNTFGALTISDNLFNGTDGESTTGAGYGLRLHPGGNNGDGNGICEITVNNNVFGKWFDYLNIWFTNGTNTSAAYRRCKQFVVTNNVSLNGYSFLLMRDFVTSFTYDGVESAIIADNIIDGQYNLVFPQPNANNIGITVSSYINDSIRVYSNTIKNRTYAVSSPDAYNNPSADVRIYDNALYNITTPYFTANQTFEGQAGSKPGNILTAETNGATEAFITAQYTGGPAASLAQQATLSYVTATNSLIVFTNGANQTVTTSNVLRPATDNTKNLGNGDFRWANVYAGNGSIITTSDEREKQQIKDIDAAVLRAWGKVNYQQFKFNDAVEKKGDNARWHIGVIAQRVKEAFESEGIDPFQMGILCYDEWDDQYQDELIEVEEQLDDGKTIKTIKSTGNKVLIMAAGNRYSIRYEEALALECAYLRSKLI